MPALNAAVLEDLDRLRISLRMGTSWSAGPSFATWRATSRSVRRMPAQKRLE
jgi:hypothetical protein